MRILLTIVILLCGCGGNPYTFTAAPLEAGVVSQDASQWYFRNGTGMPEHPSADPRGAWSFALPTAPNAIHYLVTPYRTTARPSSITATFTVIPAAPQYNAVVPQPAGVQVDTNPAGMHLFIERNNDDYSQATYRWWADRTIGAYEFGSADGTVVKLTVPLDYRHWTDVTGSQDQAAFEATLADMGNVGMTFGGNLFDGHGVNLIAGQATFVLVSFEVR